MRYLRFIIMLNVFLGCISSVTCAEHEGDELNWKSNTAIEGECFHWKGHPVEGHYDSCVSFFQRISRSAKQFEDNVICRHALDNKRVAWEYKSGSFQIYIAEAKYRELSAQDCIDILARTTSLASSEDITIKESNSSDLPLGDSLDNINLCQKSTIRSEDNVIRWGGLSILM